MKIVIDIPEKVYTYIQREWEEYDFDSVVNHAIGIGSWDDANGWYFEEIEGYTDRLTVSAWMNLPESYKEE